MNRPNKTTTTLPRDEYGALIESATLSQEHRNQMTALRDLAVKLGQIPEAYISGSSKEFECLNLDVYDVLVFRGKVTALVVQSRWFWKHKRKGYTRARKEYFLVQKQAGRVTTVPLDSATCAKRAKNTTALGDLVKHYRGTRPVKCKTPSVPVYAAFKVLAKDETGRLLSAYDDSEYHLKKWRSEAAAECHGGGFYFYLDQGLAVAATSRGETFAARVSAGKELVLCEVEVAGRTIAYSNGKWAASRLRVIRVMHGVTAAADAEA